MIRASPSRQGAWVMSLDMCAAATRYRRAPCGQPFGAPPVSDSFLEADADACPSDPGSHLGLVLLPAGYDERKAVANREPYASVTAVGDQHVSLGQQVVVGEVRRGAGVGWQRGKGLQRAASRTHDDEQVVVCETFEGGCNERSEVLVGDRALRDVDDWARAIELVPPVGRGARRARSVQRADEMHQSCSSPSGSNQTGLASHALNSPSRTSGDASPVSWRRRHAFLYARR